MNDELRAELEFPGRRRRRGRAPDLSGIHVNKLPDAPPPEVTIRDIEAAYNIGCPEETPERGASPEHDPVDADRLGGDTWCGSLGTAQQLLGVGPQNYFLDLNPETSLFAWGHKRHTPFAVEHADDATWCTFGQTAVVEVPRRGDVLGDMYLELVLPDLGPRGAWADAIGYAAFTRVRFVIDDVVVHDQERLWYGLSDALFLDAGRRAGVDAMIGRGATPSTAGNREVTVPLKFAWCAAAHADGRRQWLPLAALSRTARVTVEVTLSPLAACLAAWDTTVDPPTAAQAMVRIRSEQIVVGDDERRQLAGSRHEVLLHQEQDADEQVVAPAPSVAVDLRELNLPVKFLVFVAYEEPVVTLFRYEACIQSAVLHLGPEQRFPPRDAAYFAWVHPFAHATAVPDDPIHMYSFAMNATAVQPSGALNFAVADRPFLRARLAWEPRHAGRLFKVKVFARCINWLVIDEGSAALRFV